MGFVHPRWCSISSINSISFMKHFPSLQTNIYATCVISNFVPQICLRDFLHLKSKNTHFWHESWVMYPGWFLLVLLKPHETSFQWMQVVPWESCGIYPAVFWTFSFQPPRGELGWRSPSFATIISAWNKLHTLHYITLYNCYNCWHLIFVQAITRMQEKSYQLALQRIASIGLCRDQLFDALCRLQAERSCWDAGMAALCLQKYSYTCGTWSNGIQDPVPVIVVVVVVVVVAVAVAIAIAVGCCCRFFSFEMNLPRSKNETQTLQGLAWRSCWMGPHTGKWGQVICGAGQAFAKQGCLKPSNLVVLFEGLNFFLHILPHVAFPWLDWNLTL